MQKTSTSESRRRWALIVGFLFAFTFQKYLVRNPLDQSTGLQGVLEALLTLVTCLIVVLLSRGTPRRLEIRLALALFGIYGTFALASSINSFNPKLSMVKSVLYFAVLLTAYLLSEIKMSITFLNGVYRGYIATLLGGLSMAALSPSKYPLFSVDSYSGRTRLNVLATHPNTVGEMSGLLFLLAQVLPIRTKWYWQVFLLAINIFAGEKTATAAVLFCSGLIFLLGHRDISRRWGAATFAVSLGCLVFVFVESGVIHASPGSFLGHAAQSIYGTQVSDQAGSLDGRADLWRAGLNLAQSHVLLGFGFSGSRESLLSSVSWSGQAHNAILEASLSAGFFGMLALLAGWFSTVRGALTKDRPWNAKLLTLNLYLLCLVMIGPTFDTGCYFTILLFIAILYLDKQDEIVVAHQKFQNGPTSQALPVFNEV
jgi:O-antigen ligase